MMERITEQFQWNFPGGWWGLAAAALLLAVVIAVSYRYTRRELSAARKVTLSALRLIFCLLILLCLADPRIDTERVFTDRENVKIAVVFDESGSMLKPDQWKRDRLHDAIDFWTNKVEKDPAHQTYDFYRFGTSLRPVARVDEESVESNAAQTNFYDAIIDWNARFEAEKYGAVICFTDGIDTSQTTQESVLAALTASALPHIFVPATNELAAPPDIRFRKLEAPTHAFINTENDLTFLVRCSNIARNTAPRLEIIRDGTIIHTAEITAGTGLRTIKYRYPSTVAGTDRLTARIVTGTEVRDAVDWTIEKTEPQDSVNVLIFNGALDFGTRFIRNVFADDKSVNLDVRFAHGVFPKNTSYGSDFPSKAELKKFDVLLLMNMRQSELPASAEEDIYEFVRSGGGLLFVTGNPGTAREYARSTLEKLLPVKFDPNSPVDPRSDADTRRILQEIARGTTPTRFDGQVRASEEFTYKPPEMYKFELTDLGRKSPVFVSKTEDGKTTPVIPEFQDMALVESLKPGANLLAYYTDKTSRRHPLLAYQNFGDGRSMVLAADPLWRWRMNLPSDNHSYEIFWKNIFSYLGTGRNRQTRWLVPNLAAAGETMHAYLESPFITNPELLSSRLESSGQEKALTAEFADDKILCSFPVEGGKEYTLRAVYDKKPVAEFTFATMATDPGELEARILEPDLAALENFATLPHVRVVTDSKLVPAEHFNRDDIELKEHFSRPLWHTPVLFILMAAVYLLELIIRRFWKLI